MTGAASPGEREREELPVEVEDAIRGFWLAGRAGSYEARMENRETALVVLRDTIRRYAAPGLREAALEEAAKVCESIQAECAHTHVAGWEAGKAETRAARWCAQAIRALAAAPRTGASDGRE